MKVLVEKNDLIWLQRAGFLKDLYAVNDVWMKLLERCPPPTLRDVEEAERNKASDVGNEKPIEERIPPVQGNFQTAPPSLIHKSILIACSRANGLNLARTIKGIMNELNSSVAAELIVNDASLDFAEIEKRIAFSHCLVVLLTANALKQPEVVFAMLCAKRYFQHSSQLILIHNPESCFFPGPDEQPSSVQEFFSEKAITFLSCYALEGTTQILEKWKQEMRVPENDFKNKREAATSLFKDLANKSGVSENQLAIETLKKSLTEIDQTLQPEELDPLVLQMDKNGDGSVELSEFCDSLSRIPRLGTILKNYQEPKKEAENISTSVFLSHKRSTGQGIAGRLYEGLRNDYTVFLDSEAKFKIHDLKQIVFNTRVFVFILSSGILQSQWCLEELKSAIEDNKRVVIVRELSFKLPDTLPAAWEESLGALIKQGTELIWMAEYNAACIDALIYIIGPSEKCSEKARKYLNRNPKCIEDLKNDKHLEAGKFGIAHYIGATIGKFPIKSATFKKCHPTVFECKHYLTFCTKLTIDDVKTLTDDLFAECLQNFRHLTSLTITNCKPISNLSPLVEYCPSLQCLNFSSCDKIDDAGLYQVAEHCTSILYLYMYSCYNTTKSSIIRFIQHCTSLRYFSVGWCTDDDTLTQIAQHCTSLQWLSIYMADRISDAGLASIAQRCTSIQHLYLAGCEQITDAGLEHLEQCTSLQTLDITNCTKVTEAGITQLIQNRPSLNDVQSRGMKLLTEEAWQRINQLLADRKKT